MSNEGAGRDAQSRAIMCFDRPSGVTEGASAGRPAIEARHPESPCIPSNATSREQVDVVLPPPETKRWSSRRKAAILVAVRTGVLGRKEACQLYSLSEEELAGWEGVFDRAGIPGLLVTRLQSYRRRQERHHVKPLDSPTRNG